MTRYLFSSLLLLLLVSCALCGVVSVNGVDLFVAEKGQAWKPDSSTQQEYDVEEVTSPSIAGGIDVVFVHVLAKIRTSNNYIIFTKFIETGAGWPGNIAVKDSWKPQAATAIGNTQTIAFATVKKGTNFYTLYAHRESQSGGSKPWKFNLATGAVSGNAGEKKITWTEKPVAELKVTIKENLKAITPKDGSAFLIGDKPVFVLRGEKDSGSENVFVIARMDGDNADGEWVFAFKEAESNCDATFFSLGGMLCMAPKVESCADKDLKVWEESGNTWDTATGDIVENLKRLAKEGGFFLNANIDGKGDVLLITEKKPNTQNSQNSDFFLHFVRGKDIEKLPEPIIKDVADISDASIFYSKDQLFFLSKRGANVDLELLEDATNDIKKVLEKWGDSAVLGNSVNIGVVLLCALFGMWAPIAF